MPRTVHTFLPLAGDPGEMIVTFLGDPTVWLPDARHTGPDRWELNVVAGPVERTVEVTVGPPWRVGKAWWRSWSWVPQAQEHDLVAIERLLPHLDAELGLVEDAAGRVTLALDGRYSTPGGRVGEVLDAVALRRVSRHTVQRLLTQVAERLSAAETSDQPRS